MDGIVTDSGYYDAGEKLAGFSICFELKCKDGLCNSNAQHSFVMIGLRFLELFETMICIL